MQKVTWNNKSTPPPEQTSEPNRPNPYKDTYEGPGSVSKAETSTIDQVRQGLGLEEPEPQQDQDPWTQLLGSMKAQQGAPTGITEDPVTGELTYETPYPVPDIDEMISNPDFPVNLPTLDEIEGLYNEARQARQDELNQYRELIQEGELPPPEVDKLRRLIAFLEESIRKIDENLSKIPTIRENLRQSFKDELADLKEFGIWYAGLDQEEDLPVDEINAKIEGLDRNKDGWLGQPDAAGSFKIRMKKDSEQLVITDRDSRIVEFDPKTGMVLSQYLLDPTYSWTINSTGLAKIDPPIGDEDLTLQLPAQFNTGGTYEVAVPEYIWVKAGKNGEPEEIDDEDGYGRYIAKEFTEGAGSITQEPPEGDELENYVQVRVTKVHVASEANGSTGGNDQVISFRNGDKTLATVRITGSENNAADKHILTLTDGQGQRTSPVAIDADSMISDAQMPSDDDPTAIGKLINEYGPRAGVGMSEDAQTPAPNDSSTTDRYENVDFSRFGAEYGTACEREEYKKVGIIVNGLRGDFKGTQYTDFFFLSDAKVNMFEGEGTEEKYNPLYATTIDGGGGLDMVLGGKGDHFIKNVEFVWINAGRNDVNHIQAPGLIHYNSADPKNYVNPAITVHVKGKEKPGPRRQTWIDNVDDPNAIGGQQNKGDDKYDVDNGTKFSNPIDPDIPSWAQDISGGTEKLTFEGGISDEVDEMGSQIQERLEQGPEAGELADGVEDLIDAPYYLETQNEMDNFFDAFRIQFGLVDPEEEPDADPADITEPEEPQDT